MRKRTEHGRMVVVLACACAFMFSAKAFGAPRPATNLVASDHPNDAGESIDLKWNLSPDDGPVQRTIQSYEIRRSTARDGNFEVVGSVPMETNSFENSRSVRRGQEYWFQVIAIGHDGSRSAPIATTQPVTAVRQWFNWERKWFGAILLVISAGVLGFIQYAKRGGQIKVRKISGLEAAEEAVGRATETGRSILFIAGIQDVNDMQTIAGLTVLGRIARLAADHGAELDVPTSRSLVMTIARETVHEAYLAAGRPEAYNEDHIYYVTDEQFGFVAAVAGKMVRERPAACFYMGAFYAESLILAETGNFVGAIQVAGTAMPAQLPFFVAAADYTLIGEEFFAASAYLSGEPAQLGSLVGQDIGKFVGIVLIVVGVGLAMVWGFTGSEAAHSAVDWLVEELGKS